MKLRNKNVFFVLAVSFIMAVLRTVIVFTSMENDKLSDTDLYYLSDNFAVLTFTCITFVLFGAFAFMAYRFGRGSLLEIDDSATSSQVSSLVLGFSLIGATLIGFVVGSAESDASNLSVLEATKRSEPVLLKKILFVLIILAGIKFIVLGIINSRRRPLKPNTVAILALFPIALSAIRLLATFIDISAAPLASSGDYRILGLASALLFFLCEGKAYVIESKCRVFDMFGYFSIFTLSVYSIPTLVLRITGTFSFDSVSALSVVDIATVIYIACKLITSKSEDKCAISAIEE